MQSAVQDVDYENELDLLYAVVTLPSRGEGSDDGTEAWLCFIDNTTGHVIKKVLLPTWKTVSEYILYILCMRYRPVLILTHTAFLTLLTLLTL